jgi:aspartate-semialdehyde dehydrogenase
MSSGNLRAVRAGIVGASTLRGKELKVLMEERGFPAEDVRLLDDDTAAGTLTEAAGEATFIHTVTDDSFEKLDFIFFASSPEFAARHIPAALRAGARVIDLSDAVAASPEAAPWIPSLDALFPPPPTARTGSTLFSSPPAGSVVAATLSAAFASRALQRIALVLFQPVSERGQSGIEELESQTVNLLSFQPISRSVYDAQVAFNLLPQFGPECREQLSAVRKTIVDSTARYLNSRVPVPAIQVVQVPVFYSLAFSAYAEFERAVQPPDLDGALRTAGIHVQGETESVPDNISVAGESRIFASRVERDANGFWIWGAADNIRLAASNALSIAEKLLAS